MDTAFLKDIFLIIVVGAGGIFALYQFSKQQKFKRLQNLSSLWKTFLTDAEIMELFTFLNATEEGESEKISQIASFEPKVKLKYLALIEEVSLYIDAFEIDKGYAKYLFQWHFFFVYESKTTSSAFWENIGGKEEMNASYWSKSRLLAQKFIPE
ncbi:MAG: hypothetical protein U5M51_10185 [Emticicia sp.]|nr:hypothetical protein [Emticicia sp.]